MTAVKVAFRLKAPDLAFGESFQARHQARIDRPIDDLDEFFKDVRASSDSGLNRFKRALQSDQVFARTLYSAISPGTEIAAFLGCPPLRPGKLCPRVVGYCNVAEVLAIGAGVTLCRTGDTILKVSSCASLGMMDSICRW